MRKRIRLSLRHLQQMECEPLRRAAPDPGQAGQLRDEVLDGGGEHDSSVTVRVGCLERSPDATDKAVG